MLAGVLLLSQQSAGTGIFATLAVASQRNRHWHDAQRFRFYRPLVVGPARRLDIYGCWILITLWVWIAAAMYAVRFWQGKWRAMRVIEPAEAGATEALSVAAE